MSDKTGDDILANVRSVAQSLYGPEDLSRISRVGNDVVGLFAGDFDAYHACDTLYHDLEHTLQIINPFTRIIEAWNRAGSEPRISFHSYELGLVAVLLHDTGYIKKAGDDTGTGGKYTFVHIDRSISFAEGYLPSAGFTDGEVRSVCNMILCTGVIERLEDVHFSSEEERLCGFALGTADIIGQMSARNYPEKLVHLYREFRESYDYEGRDLLKTKGAVLFESAEALIRSTPSFYADTVRKRFRQMGSLDRFVLGSIDGKDSYSAAIERNLKRLTDGRRADDPKQE